MFDPYADFTLIPIDGPNQHACVRTVRMHNSLLLSDAISPLLRFCVSEPKWLMRVGQIWMQAKVSASLTDLRFYRVLQATHH